MTFNLGYTSAAREKLVSTAKLVSKESCSRHRKHRRNRTGAWKNDRQNGHGTFRCGTTRQVYTGKWVGGQRCGKGNTSRCAPLPVLLETGSLEMLVLDSLL